MNSIVKYIFYVSLYFHTKALPITLFPFYDLNILKQHLSLNEIQDIFYRQRLTSIGIPDINENNICIKNNNVLLNLDKYQYNHKDAYFQNENIGLKNIDVFFLLKPSVNSSSEIQIEFENVKEINITLMEININEKYNINNYFFKIVNNKVIIQYNLCKKENILDYVIKFNCNETLNENFIFKIKSILII